MGVFILSSLLRLEYWDCKKELKLSKDTKFNLIFTVWKGAQKTVMNKTQPGMYMGYVRISF